VPVPIILILLAAICEVLGDAFMRHGLRSANRWGLLVGAVLLIVYGVSVNLPKWDFGRLLGIYIAAFFLVAQLTAVLFFHERPKAPIFVGGSLIIAGGAIIALWQPK
jgi:drug/metabolite transporter superfamily protein YnfA